MWQTLLQGDSGLLGGLGETPDETEQAHPPWSSVTAQWPHLWEMPATLKVPF